MKLRALFCLLIVVFGLPELVAQERPDPKLSDALDELERSRASIRTYALVMTVHEKQWIIVNQPDVPPLYVDQHTTHEMLCDLMMDRLVVVTRSHPMLPFSSQAFNSSVSLIDGTQASFLHQLAATWTECRPTEVQVPNPLVLGLTFCDGLRGYQSFERNVGNLRGWGERTFERKDGDWNFVDYSAPEGDPSRFQRSTIRFSPRKAWLPTEVSHGDKNRRSVEIHVEPTLVNSVWLPKFCQYRCNESMVIDIHLDWRMVNEPLPEAVFDPRRILAAITDSANRTSVGSMPWPTSPTVSDDANHRSNCEPNIAPTFHICRLLSLASVHKALGIDEVDIADVVAIVDRAKEQIPMVQEDEHRSLQSARDLTREMIASTEMNDDLLHLALIETLDPTQLDTLYGIFLIHFGWEAISNRRIAMALQLSDEQIRSLDELIRDSRQSSFDALLKGGRQPDKFSMERLAFRAFTLPEQLSELFSDAQKERFEELLKVAEPHSKILPPAYQFGWPCSGTASVQ